MSSVVKDLVPVLDTSIYADGDVLFIGTEITMVSRAASGIVDLNSIEVLDEDDQGITMDLVFANAAPSIGTINTACSISDANARLIVGLGSPNSPLRLLSANYVDLGGSKSQIVSPGGRIARMQCAATRSLWVAGITRGTPTHSASGLRFKLGFTQLS